jgi:hypothetical protein
MIWRFALIGGAIIALYTWSATLAEKDLIYSAMRLPVFWITVIGFLLTQIKSSLLGFRKRGNQ